MLTLLRVRRAARLRRRPKLDGASRPLRSAGSWQPSFCDERNDGINQAYVVRLSVLSMWPLLRLCVRHFTMLVALS